VVGTPHYAIHHNPEYYPDPFAYIPERWVAGSDAAFSDPRHVTYREKEPAKIAVHERDVAVAQSAFCPFSIGPRGCIGKGLAYVEMTTTLARLLFLYDIRRAAGVADPAEGKDGAEWGRHRAGEMQLVDTFTSLKEGVMVEFRRRDNA